MAAVLCLVLPLSDGFADVSKEKVEIKLAGQWLLEKEAFPETRMLVTEERVAYYAGLLRRDYVYSDEIDVKNLEQKAVENESDIIILYRSNSDFKELSEFKEFTLVKEFSGTKKTVSIYGRRG